MTAPSSSVHGVQSRPSGIDPVSILTYYQAGTHLSLKHNPKGRLPEDLGRRLSPQPPPCVTSGKERGAGSEKGKKIG